MLSLLLVHEVSFQQVAETAEPQVSRSGRLIKPKKFLDEGEEASRPLSAAATPTSTPVGTPTGMPATRATTLAPTPATTPVSTHTSAHESDSASVLSPAPNAATAATPSSAVAPAAADEDTPTPADTPVSKAPTEASLPGGSGVIYVLDKAYSFIIEVFKRCRIKN